MNPTVYPPMSSSGIPEGVYYGQNARVEELNERIESRHFPDLALAPNFDPRPTPTKRMQFPMVNMRAIPSAPIQEYANFSTKNNFYPGTQAAPPLGYAANVETEMRLRNQYFALQHCDQNVYVPSTESDLYKVQAVGRTVEQPYPYMFVTPVFENPAAINNLNPAVGGDMFYNNTRTQLRNTVQM